VTPAVTNPATNFVDITTNQVVSIQQNGTGVALIATAPSNTAIVGASKASPIAGIIAGVEAITSVPTGYGLYARQLSSTSPGVAPTGVYAQSDSPNGAGMRAWEPYASGPTFGLVGGAASTGGTAIQATETAISGATFGLVAKVLSPAGTAALILNNATGTITGPLIQAKTNAGVQFSVDGSGNVNAAGSFSGTRLISTVATGTAPLQVASTTLVPNLNASLLGGSPASAFALASGSPNYIQNGTALQSGANFNISGNGSANSFNSATTYEIGGTSVLTVGDNPQQNLFVGQIAGVANTSGVLNTFLGYAAGELNGTGVQNTFVGASAGVLNGSGQGNTYVGNSAGERGTTASDNTFVGTSAGLNNTTGSNNTYIGLGAGIRASTGGANTFIGGQSGSSTSTGSRNTFSGVGAGAQNTAGSHNTFTGYSSGINNTTGSYNIYLGSDLAGYNNTIGNNNIYVGNPGCAYPCTENSTIRIGGDIGGGYGPQTATYIAGIYSSAVGGSGIAMYVDSNGQLGTTVSSRRFKEQIRDMGDSTNALMKLRPVTFLYKPEYDKGARTLQYGLIAEEVAEVYPDLVAYEPDGKPYTVKYQYLTTMLLNEMQKQYHRAEAEAEVITQQEDKISLQERKIDQLERRLSHLEAVIGQPRIAQAQVRPATQN
jgi:Chaperone of endosialidase